MSSHILAVVVKSGNPDLYILEADNLKETLTRFLGTKFFTYQDAVLPGGVPCLVWTSEAAELLGEDKHPNPFREFVADGIHGTYVITRFGRSGVMSFDVDDANYVADFVELESVKSLTLTKAVGKA